MGDLKPMRESPIQDYAGGERIRRSSGTPTEQCNYFSNLAFEIIKEQTLFDVDTWVQEGKNWFKSCRRIFRLTLQLQGTERHLLRVLVRRSHQLASDLLLTKFPMVTKLIDQCLIPDSGLMYWAALGLALSLIYASESSGK